MSENDVGFVIAGGRDDPHCGGGDGAVYVTSVTKDGPFERKLRCVSIAFYHIVSMNIICIVPFSLIHRIVVKNALRQYSIQ